MITEATTKNTLVDLPRLHALAAFAQDTSRLPGSIAEVGVYKGGTARLLCENANGRIVYLFDTFAGMPPVSKHDLHHAGDFGDTSARHVLDVLAPLTNYVLCPGIFPNQSGKVIEGEKFSLVHIDCDIYRSVKESLKFFYPRMVAGGVIVLDDYAEPNCPGAKLAVDEFLVGKPEVIFHTCQSSVAIRKDSATAAPIPVRFLHTGDLGDIIAALPIVRTLGGGEVIISEIERPLGHGPRESMRGQRYEALRPLLEVQPYIEAVGWQDYLVGIKHDLSEFRGLKRDNRENLAQWQARNAGVPSLRLDPWLRLPHPKVVRDDYIVMARSERYHNYFFPWGSLIYELEQRCRILFVGSPEEHRALEKETGHKLEYHPTADLLEVAELIGSAKLTICNQSAPFWIAAGLGAAVIQESWGDFPNSIVERANAFYTRSGPETRTLIYRLPEIMAVV